MTAKITIRAISLPGTGYTSHLQPILDYLATLGNYPDGDEGFSDTKSGTVCTMQQPIDWDDLLEHFELPSSISICREQGYLRDDRCIIDLIAGATAEEHQRALEQIKRMRL